MFRLAAVLTSVLSCGACTWAGGENCSVRRDVAEQLALSCFAGGECYAVPGFASAASSDRSELDVRADCRQQMAIYSSGDVRGGKDYVFRCTVGDVVGIVRVFLSQTSSKYWGCSLVRYAFVDDTDIASVDEIIPRIEYFDGQFFD